MNKIEFVNSFDRKNTLGDVESRYIFRECIVLDQHRHEITTREEFHD